MVSEISYRTKVPISNLLPKEFAILDSSSPPFLF